ISRKGCLAIARERIKQAAYARRAKAGEVVMNNVIQCVNAFDAGISNQSTENTISFYHIARERLLETEAEREAFRWGVMAKQDIRKGDHEMESRMLKRYIRALQQI